jgi:hypothetical protein
VSRIGMGPAEEMKQLRAAGGFGKKVNVWDVTYFLTADPPPPHAPKQFHKFFAGVITSDGL